MSYLEFVDEHPKRKRFVKIDVIRKGRYLGKIEGVKDAKKSGDMKYAYLVMMTKIAIHFGANLAQVPKEMKEVFDLLLLMTKASKQDRLVFKTLLLSQDFIIKKCLRCNSTKRSKSSYT